MKYDYRNHVILTCEKLLRQRTYYIALAKKWQAEMDAMSDDQAFIQRTRIDTIMRVATDLKFVCDRSLKNLPVEDLEVIQDMASNKGGKN